MRGLTSLSLLGAAATAVVLCESGLRADVIGFGDYSGFTINQGDNAAAPTASGSTIQITNERSDEVRSIFANTPQKISAFTASFTYRATNVSAANTSGGGAAFVLQDTSAGAGAVGYGGPYSNGGVGLSPSAEVTLELYEYSANTGYYTNGAKPGGSASTSPLNLGSGNSIDVTLTYNGTTLHETLADTVTGDTYSTSYFANIPATLGEATAYVGVTAGNGYQEQADQYISNFQFTSQAPEPAAIGLMGSAFFGLMARRRRRQP